MSERGVTVWKSAGVFLLAGGMLLAAISCDESETVAPPDSTITLSFNPAQVIQDSAGTQIVPVTILATVRDSIGVPLPGQDVRFTTNSGVLTPQAGTPVTTDHLGNAVAILTAATVGPSITATSGKATDNKTLSASKGEVSRIVLNIDSTDLTDCTDVFTLTAEARKADGTPVKDFEITFEFTTTADTNFTGTFDPRTGLTDTNGQLASTLTPNNNTCNDRCVPSGKTCTSRVRARDASGLIFSDEIEIVDQIN